jgi:hypothetical protein
MKDEREGDSAPTFAVPDHVRRLDYLPASEIPTGCGGPARYRQQYVSRVWAKANLLGLPKHVKDAVDVWTAGLNATLSTY